MRSGADWRCHFAQQLLAAAIYCFSATAASGQTPATWIGESGDWFDPSNWSTNPVIPNGEFAVDIPDVGSPVYITLGSSVSLSSLTITGPFIRFSPSAGTFSVTGSINLQGGQFLATDDVIIRNSSLHTSGGTYGVFNSGDAIPTFDNVALHADLELLPGQRARIRNGLALDGSTIRLNGGAGSIQLIAAGTQTIGGSGTILFDGISSSYLNATDGPLTLGPGISLLTGTRGGTVSISSSMINQGLISARTTFRTLSIGGSGPFVNQGTLEALNASTLSLNGQWTNLGTITATFSQINLGGSFALSDLGTFLINSSTINLTGTLNNASTTLNVDAGNQNWRMLGGRVNGGTISVPFGSPFPASGTFDGVTFEVDVLEPGLNIVNGLTLVNAFVRGGSITAGVSQTISGAGSISGTSVRAAGGTLTLGPSILTTGTTNLVATSTLINTGLVSSQTAGRTLNVSGTGSFINQGAMEATNAATLALGSRWTNAGTIAVTNSWLNLGGTFSPGAIGTIINNGGTINLTGRFQNDGTFTLDAGSWTVLTGGSVDGGTFLTANGAKLRIAGSATFSNVSLSADMDFAPGASATLSGTWSNQRPFEVSGATANLMGTFAMNGAQVSNGTLNVLGSWVNTGSLSFTDSMVNLGGTFSAASVEHFKRTGGTVSVIGRLNLTDSFTLDSNTGSWYLGDATGSTQKSANIQGGTIATQPGTQFIAIGRAAFTDTAIATDLVFLNNSVGTFAGSWSNSGSWQAAGATVNFGGTFSAGADRIDGGTVNVRGSWNNAGNVINLDTGATKWRLSGGTINGGTIRASGGSLESFGGVLNSTLLELPLYVSAGTTMLQGDWRNDGTILLKGGVLSLGGNVDFDNLGSVQVTSGSVMLTGALENSGSNVDLDGMGFPLWIATGSVHGGTISGSQTNSLLLGWNNVTTATLNGVTLDVPTHTQLRSGRVVISDGLVLNSTLTINAGGQLSFVGTQTLDGNGTVLFDNLGDIQGVIVTQSGALTLGNGMTVRSGTGRGVLNGNVLNQGTISAATASHFVRAIGTFNNQGLVEALNGGSIFIPNSNTLTNYASNSLNGGRWAVYAGSTISIGNATIQTNDANVLLDGPDSQFIAINSLNTNLGSFAINAGRNFTTIGSLTNSGFLGVGTNSVLRVAGALNNTGSIDLIGTLIVDYAPGESESAIFDELASQINTSIFTSLLNPSTGIGSVDNIDLGYTTFAGQAIDATAVLMRLTSAGDADLNGLSELSDFDRFLTGFSAAEATALWITGDFNYSGTVDLVDFTAFLHGYYGQGGSKSEIMQAVEDAPLSPTDREAMLELVATVPEPNAGILVLLGYMGMLGRWRVRARAIRSIHNKPRPGPQISTAH